MKTIELTLVGIASVAVYTSYIYYLLTMNNDPKPTNLWYGIGSGLDEFFFNSGTKPKQSIENAPNKIVQRLDQ